MPLRGSCQQRCAVPNARSKCPCTASQQRACASHSLVSAASSAVPALPATPLSRRSSSPSLTRRAQARRRHARMASDTSRRPQSSRRQWWLVSLLLLLRLRCASCPARPQQALHAARAVAARMTHARRWCAGSRGGRRRLREGVERVLLGCFVRRGLGRRLCAEGASAQGTRQGRATRRTWSAGPWGQRPLSMLAAMVGVYARARSGCCVTSPLGQAARECHRRGGSAGADQREATRATTAAGRLAHS
jgi:hypothetical protein